MNTKITFREFNPVGENRRDCVVRALVALTDDDYDTVMALVNVYQLKYEKTTLARRRLMGAKNGVHTHTEWFKGLMRDVYGMEYREVGRIAASYTAEEIATLFGDCIVSMPGHFTTLRNNELVDSYDPRNRYGELAVKGIWLKKQ